MGGFAVAMRYGLHRTTADLDIAEAVPSSGLQAVLALGGRGTALALEGARPPGQGRGRASAASGALRRRRAPAQSSTVAGHPDAACSIRSTWSYDWSVKSYLERFGDRALVDIRTADVQDFIADLRKPRAIHRRGVRVLSASRVNKIIDLLRHMFNWAVGREYIDHTPFRRGSETLIKKFKDDNKRRRGIDQQEESALLAHAPRHIQALLIAAIDTGMRSGEMLALRFADIALERGLITRRGETTKSRKRRLVPISTTRLRDVLTWLRQDVEGKPKPLETRVFSNELGEPYRLFHRQWQSIVLKAHGHTPTWNPRLNYQGLSDESQAVFRRIDLRWHDLRHEYASRLVEHGVPLAQVRDLLGHASITTTERYDNQTMANLRLAAAKLERGLGFGSTPPPPSDAEVRSPGKTTDRRTSPAATAARATAQVTDRRPEARRLQTGGTLASRDETGATAGSESRPYLSDQVGGRPKAAGHRREPDSLRERRTDFQDSFKIEAKVEQNSDSPRARRSGAKYLKRMTG